MSGGLESTRVDPETVVADARGDVDERLLTRTSGGFLGRSVLAEDPLITHLAGAETLHYLLAGPAAPTRAEGGTRERLATRGSYRTLLAVTDDRLLLVAGSRDGDRVVSMPYGALSEVELRRGLLTDAVVAETTDGVTWTVSVGAGSDVGDAVAYAADRLSEPGGVEMAAGSVAVDGETGDAVGRLHLDDVGAVGDSGHGDGAAESDDANRLDVDLAAGDVDLVDVDRIDGPNAGSVEPGDDAGPAADAERWPAESEFVTAMYETVVGPERVPAVEGGADGSLRELLADLDDGRERLREELADGTLEAAVPTAAGVDALAAEGERLAEARGEAAAAREFAGKRREARRAVVVAALGLRDRAVVEADLRPGIERLLRTVDPDAFEQFVADLWAELGFQTVVTQSSKDRGVDVVARQTTPIEQTVVIQAKRYAATNKVGRESVQQYASLHRQERDADLVVVVTTGAFTGPAREAARDLNVKLVDGERLVEMVVERDCLDLVVRHAGG